VPLTADYASRQKLEKAIPTRLNVRPDRLSDLRGHQTAWENLRECPENPLFQGITREVLPLGFVQIERIHTELYKGGKTNIF
jgi:hypothetical protein